MNTPPCVVTLTSPCRDVVNTTWEEGVDTEWSICVAGLPHTLAYRFHAPTNYFFFFLDLRKSYLSKNAFYGFRWTSKTPTVPNSYKRCTSWLELETCCADLKLFAITSHPLRPINYPLHVHFNPYLAKIGCAFVSILNLVFKILIVLN
jgi:hypothetical protein